MSTPQPPEARAPVPAPERKTEPERQSTWQPSLYLKIALLLLALGYSIAFVVENSKEINIHFVFGTAKVRLIWEILLLLAIGIVAGILFSQLYRHRRGKPAKKPG